jgi:O-antigen/teichoic acid export membrane protein
MANSLSSVFLKKANDLYISDKNSLSYFIQDLITKLFILCVIPFSILSVFGKELVTIFLGNQWLLAGNISTILSPYFFTLLIISPIVPVLQVLQKERQLFLFDFSGFILNIIALIIGTVWNDIELLLILYTISNVILYLILCVYIFKLNKLPYWRIVIGYFIVYPILIMILTFIKRTIFYLM